MDEVRRLSKAYIKNYSRRLSRFGSNELQYELNGLYQNPNVHVKDKLKITKKLANYFGQANAPLSQAPVTNPVQAQVGTPSYQQQASDISQLTGNLNQVIQQSLNPIASSGGASGGSAAAAGLSGYGNRRHGGQRMRRRNKYCRYYNA